MANEKSVADTGTYKSAQATIRTIGAADLMDALGKGIDDFKLMPTHLIFLCIIYPIVTLVYARTAAGYDVLPLVFPLLAGYTLIGPLVATGVYELSRRRELGDPVSRWQSFEVLRSHSIISIAILGVILMVLYFVWLIVAQVIYAYTFGDWVPSSIGEFVGQVFGTGAGWTLIVVGSGFGFLIAVVVFSLSVVSFPLLLDRDAGVVTAIGTSIRVVMANPMTMALWGLIVAVTMLVGALPFFVGLAVVLPVLGHATWHVYRKVVEY